MARKLTRAWGVMAGLLVTVSSGYAQTPGCPDDLDLKSPTSLTATFVKDGKVEGNLLSWPDVPSEIAACYRVEIDPAIAAAFNPQITGGYLDLFDREMLFTIQGAGVVGDRTTDGISLFVAANHPNGAVPPLNGFLNVTNRGGVYRFDTGTGNAAQSNGSGAARIPSHLSTTSITDFALWTGSGSAHRLYAAVPGLPMIVSSDGGATWAEASPDGSDPIGFRVSHLAVDPNDPDVVFAGTDKNGLWRSLDGGASFARADRDLTTTNSAVTGLAYLSVETSSGPVNRLFVSISGIGFFYSDDNADTFQVADLVLPTSLEVGDCLNDLNPAVKPRVHTVVVSPSDPARLYLGLDTYGVYRSDDGGGSWVRANSGLVICETGNLQMPARPINAKQLMVFKTRFTPGQDHLIIATEFRGTFVSPSSGDTWAGPNSGHPTNQDGFLYKFTQLIEHPTDPMSAYAATDGGGLVITSDLGSTWCVVGDTGCGPDTGILTPKLGGVIQSPIDPDVLIVGTLGGGVYEPGTEVPIRRVLDPSLLPPAHVGANLDVGISITLNAGPVADEDEFVVKAHSFQGYVVWRATSFRDAPIAADREPAWQLVGMYDRTNPEFCFEGGCDVQNPVHIVECFADKRANCFTFQPDGTVEFFDREIYNGFTYQYAVSTYDYGYSGNTSPEGFDGDMVFSPRSAVESSDQSPFPIQNNYNQIEFQVNVEARTNLDDVIVVPNPLRRQGGWDSGDDVTIRFVNVTGGAICEIFTLSGDQVARLTNRAPSGADRGNIQWDTRNQAGELVASGVYIFRVTDDAGNELVSRFTIIR